MAFEPFNSVGGLTIGIPPVPAIDANGNLVSNVLSPNGNVIAGNVYAANYYYSNGGPIVSNPAGSNTQVQYNANGVFGASANFTFDSTNALLAVSNIQIGTNANLGDVGNITILGGNNGYFLQTDGTGNLTWSPAGNGTGGNGTPGGANTQVQYNDSGNFGGNAAFTFNELTGTLSAPQFIGNVTGNLTGYASNANLANTVIVNAQPNITSVGNLTALVVEGNTTLGNSVTANYFIGNLYGQSNTANAVTDNAQPNITSVGTLTSLVVSGNTTLGNSVTANYFIGNLYGTANTALTANTANTANVANTANSANFAANATVATYANYSNFAGVVANAAQPNITSLGNLTSLTVSGNANISGVVSVTGSITSSNFVGNLTGTASNANFATLAATSNIANIANTAYSVNAANISGTVANANYALYAGQSNTANSATIAASANSVAGANVTGTVANANFALTSGSANTAATVTSAAQPNITSVGTLSSLNVSGNIAGGNLSVTGNISANYITGTLSTGNQPGITNVGTLTNLTVTGNVTANNFIGNITGNISNANFASYAGNVTIAAQSNITTVGTLGNLTVSGNSTTNNITVTSNVVANNINVSNLVHTYDLNVTNNSTIARLVVTGNASAGNINGGNNVTANFFTGTLTTNNQPNINYLGSLGWLNVDTSLPNSNGNISFNGSMSGTGVGSNINITGNLTAGNYVQANIFIGTLATSSQPNITSLGNLSSLTVTGLSNLGNVSNITILGGNANYVLSTDGTGNLSWVEQSGGNANGVPGGLNTQVQYNKNGNFAGDASFTWNDTSKTLSLGNTLLVNNTVSTLRLVSSVATGTAPFVVTSTTPVANLGVETSGTVRNGSQPNITSVGTLTSLVVSGNANVGNLGVGGSFSLSGNFSAGNISTPGQLNTTGLTVTGNATFTNNAIVSPSGTLRINGNVNAGNAANVYLGTVSNIHIDGGINGYVLSTDGAGGLSWTAQSGGGGNGTPGGANTQIQYNDTGFFGGSPFFTFNEATTTVQVAGNLIANSFQMGAGIYSFSYSNVYAIITNSATPNQLLWSVDANSVSGVEFTIISTDSTANVRQISKMVAVVLGNSVNYNETNTIAVNGYNGDFTIEYIPGNIIADPSVGLYFSPVSGNTMIHKMQITAYEN